MRRNIDPLSKCSTREGSRKSSPAPDRPPNFANFNKVEKNELHYRQYQQYQQYYNHQHYNQRLLRLRLTRHHRQLGRLRLPHYKVSLRSTNITQPRLRLDYFTIASLRSTINYYYHPTSAVVDSPPFGRFVIILLPNIIHHRRSNWKLVLTTPSAFGFAR